MAVTTRDRELETALAPLYEGGDMTTEPQTAAPLSAEEEATMRARLDDDWCLTCDEYRNTDVPRLLATLDATRARSGLDAGLDIWNLCCLVDIEPTRAAAALADPAKLRRLGVKDRRDADGQAAAFLATVMGAAALASSGEAAPVDGLDDEPPYDDTDLDQGLPG